MANTFEQQFETKLQSLLSGWDVETEVSVGAFTPDLILKGPDGQTVVIEVKATDDDILHFGTIDYVHQVTEATQSTPHSRGIVVTTSPATEAMRQLAASYDISLCVVPNDPDSAAQDVVNAVNDMANS